MNIVKVVKTITHCSQCEFCEQKRYYTADSWETEDIFNCKKADGKKIGIFEWRHTGVRDVIPDWCPRLTNNND